jgi:DNA (cytosine-5)-methyltransferase 1
MLRVVAEVNPTWVIGENVPGIIHMELDRVLSDLENQGYETQTFIIPACAVDAPHRRDRVWIVAHDDKLDGNGGRFRSSKISQFKETGAQDSKYDVADADNQGLSSQWEQRGVRKKKRQACSGTQRTSLLGGEWNPTRWLPEPTVGRVANGIPRRVDRLRSLGLKFSDDLL